MEQQVTDDAFLRSLGARLAGLRVARNLTQAELAEQAGIGIRTLQRLELGEAATQLSGFIRVCRALGLIERLEGLVPEAAASPLAQWKQQAKTRKRASKKRSARVKEEPSKWTWGT